MNGSGAQIYGTADGFQFAYQSLSGDGSIVARVVSLQSSTYAQAGVMIRETLSAGATHAFVNYQNNQNPPIKFLDRLSTGGSTDYQTASSGSIPYWVKVVRSGSTFSGYASSDGVNWTQVGSSVTISMAQNVYIGLAVSGYTNSASAIATFDKVSISSTSAPAPLITSLSATTGPVGSQVVITGSNFGGTQSGSVVWLNGTPATINSWSSSSITITIPSGATSGALLLSVAPGMNASNFVNFTVTYSRYQPGG